MARQGERGISMKVYNQDTNPNLRTQFEECVKEVFSDVDRFLDLIDRGGTYEKFDVVTGRDRPDDEYYVIDRETGEYINWYKYVHIGRSIHMNFNPEKMKDFLTRFKESEVEVVNHKEREE